MKICAIICEFNPFHYGHGYLIGQAKARTGCDAVLCIMSGNFTQRGECCSMDKFTRAKHAVTCGADCVIELPTAFAVAPAEIFAKGAIKLLSSIPSVSHLAFGCETLADFFAAAKILSAESEPFKAALRSSLDAGESYVKSYARAFASCGGEENLLDRPNNILAVEYARAILDANADINLCPVERVGGGYADGELRERYSSARAIRRNADDRRIADNLPPCVYADFIDAAENAEAYETVLRYALLNASKEKLKDIFGCGEGLERKLQALATLPVEEIVSQTAGKRYTEARIRRILCADALNLSASESREFLRSPLYLKPLAVRKERKDQLFAALAESSAPVVVKKRDAIALDPSAKRCLERDLFASSLWELIHKKPIYDFTVENV